MTNTTNPALEPLEKAFGFIPSAAVTMAESPALLQSFLAAFGQFRGAAPFTPAERQVLLLTNAVTNGCAWAVAFHTFEALQDGVAPADVEAIRAGRAPADARAAALSALSRALITHRGRIDTEGFELAEVLDVIAGVAISTMTNYAAAAGGAAVQDQYHQYTWSLKE